MLPDAPDPELEKFMRQWAAQFPYDVRGKVGIE